MTTETKAPTLDQLKAELKQVLNSTPIDDGKMIMLTKAINKNSQDIVKAEAEKQKKEGEALAGDREKLATEIWSQISPETKAKLNKVKAKGYTFKLDEADVQYKSVSLTVPAIRKAGGGGGGGTGETIQSKTGMRRGELVDKFATDEEKATIKKARDNASSSPGSAQWGAEKPVVKRILADHPELVK